MTKTPLTSRIGLRWLGAVLTRRCSRTTPVVIPAIGAHHSSLANRVSNPQPPEVTQARSILSNLPGKKPWTFNYWRGQLADIVMSSEEMVKKFSVLTNLMLMLDKIPGSFNCPWDMTKSIVFKQAVDKKYTTSEERELLPYFLIDPDTENYSHFGPVKFSV